MTPGRRRRPMSDKNVHFARTRETLRTWAEDPSLMQTGAEARRTQADVYFEYHLKVDAPVSQENDELLKRLARGLTRELDVKVPFSCNNMRDKNQRFLNARTYGLGYGSSSAVVQRVA